MNFPDLLSISRIFLLIPILILFEFGYFYSALVIYITACITDFLDGFLARKLNKETQLGALLDLLADKIFVSILLIWATYNFDSVLILLSTFMIISRELTIGYLRMYFLQKGFSDKSLKSNFFGKLKTTLQMFGLGALFLGPLSDTLTIIAIYLIFISAVFSLLSLANYSIKWITESEKKKT